MLQVLQGQRALPVPEAQQVPPEQLGSTVLPAQQAQQAQQALREQRVRLVAQQALQAPRAPPERLGLPVPQAPQVPPEQQAIPAQQALRVPRAPQEQQGAMALQEQQALREKQELRARQAQQAPRGRQAALSRIHITCMFKPPLRRVETAARKRRFKPLRRRLPWPAPMALYMFCPAPILLRSKLL